MKKNIITMLALSALVTFGGGVSEKLGRIPVDITGELKIVGTYLSGATPPGQKKLYVVEEGFTRCRIGNVGEAAADRHCAHLVGKTVRVTGSPRASRYKDIFLIYAGGRVEEVEE